jgi:hypothetical protein
MGPQRMSAIADMRHYKVPISGKPEIGCAGTTTTVV